MGECVHDDTQDAAPSTLCEALAMRTPIQCNEHDVCVSTTLLRLRANNPFKHHRHYRLCHSDRQGDHYIRKQTHTLQRLFDPWLSPRLFGPTSFGLQSLALILITCNVAKNNDDTNICKHRLLRRRPSLERFPIRGLSGISFFAMPHTNGLQI